MTEPTASSRPRVQTVQLVLTSGHGHFTTKIPPMVVERCFIIITNWTFQDQPFSVGINDAGDAVECFFSNAPYKRKRWFGKDVITVALVELP